MYNNIIGKCSLCGGDVTRPNYTLLSDPPQTPTATCTSCGATDGPPKTIRVEPEKLPVIKMIVPSKLKKCPDCGREVEDTCHPCGWTYGRRGWRQLGMYDG